jgi:hypothetical protein
MQQYDMDRYNLKKLNDVECNEQQWDIFKGSKKPRKPQGDKNVYQQ